MPFRVEARMRGSGSRLPSVFIFPHPGPLPERENRGTFPFAPAGAYPVLRIPLAMALMERSKGSSHWERWSSSNWVSR